MKDTELFSGFRKKYEFENNRNKWSHITLATIQRGPLVAAETAEDIKTLDKKPNTSRSILGTTWWKGRTQLPQVILGFLHGFKHGHVQATWTHTTRLLKKMYQKGRKKEENEAPLCKGINFIQTGLFLHFAQVRKQFQKQYASYKGPCWSGDHRQGWIV